MATSIEQEGFRDTTVADVVRIARTSRRSFYEHFKDRAACFLALFDATNEALMQRIADVVHPDEPWEIQVEQAVGAYLDSVAAQPALSSSFVRELPALGERGSASQLAVIERFAQLLVGLVELGRSEQPELAAGPLTMDAAIIIVGGLRELVVIAIQQGRDVRALLPTAVEAVTAILRATILPGLEQAPPARS
jgi:AcrR family transcriptional regulator